MEELIDESTLELMQFLSGAALVMIFLAALWLLVKS